MMSVRPLMPADANCFDSTSYLSCTHKHSTAQHSSRQHSPAACTGAAAVLARRPAAATTLSPPTEHAHDDRSSRRTRVCAVAPRTLITIVLHEALCVSSSLTDPSFFWLQPHMPRHTTWHGTHSSQ